MTFDRDLLLQLAKLRWGSGGLKKAGVSLTIIGAFALTGTAFDGMINAFFIGNGLPPPIPNLPPWIGLTILFTGVAMLVVGPVWERPDVPAKVNPHDIALLKQFRSEFHAGLREFLRKHAFGNSFPSQLVQPVFHVANWQGPEYELTDREAEKQFAKVKACAGKMADLLAYKTWPHRVQKGFHTALPDNHDEWAPASEVLKTIEELNSGARELIEATDQFERMALVRFPTD